MRKRNKLMRTKTLTHENQNPEAIHSWQANQYNYCAPSEHDLEHNWLRQAVVESLKQEIDAALTKD